MRAVDLFSGCGGLSLGFENAGYEIAAAFENWGPAIEVYRANFSHRIIECDLSDVESAGVLVSTFEPDIIIGGPPCQDFSHAGKRTEGGRANLTVSFAKIVASVRPLWFLMENVDRAFGSYSFRAAARVFRKAGYGLTVSILDASLCGVPQKRKRLVCVGKLYEAEGFLGPNLEAHIAKRPMTVREYMGNALGVEFYYRHPRNYSRRAIYSIDEPAATVRGVNRPIPVGYKRHPGDRVSPKQARPLTTDERAVIQTFPSGFRWIGSKTDREQMIGNAVPVKLGEFVAHRILEYSAGVVCNDPNLQLPFRTRDDNEHGIDGVQVMASALHQAE